MPVLRSLLVLTAAAVLAVGSLVVALDATASTAAGRDRTAQPTSHRLSARFLREARKSLVSYLRDDHPQVELVHSGLGPSRPGGTSAVSSYNWSGYADSAATKGTFTRVSGQWMMPRVTCASEDTITSEWVGIDGWSNSTVEQAGTLGWCFEGKATYFTWYEMYPAGTITVGNSLQPGDKITATVSRSGASYTLALTDSTHPANSFVKKATCAVTTCLDTSVEWIAERPSFAIGVAPLADYASWKVTGASQTSGGPSGTIASYPVSYQASMVDATVHYQLSSASTLTGGNSFTTTWRNSY